MTPRIAVRVEGGGISIPDRTFERSPVRIGRSGLNDLRLDLPYVSGYQGAVIFDQSTVRYVEASRYAALVNGSPAPRDVPVDVGDDGGVIEIGEIRIVVTRPEGAHKITKTDQGAPRRSGPPVTAADHLTEPSSSEVEAAAGVVAGKRVAPPAHSSLPAFDEEIRSRLLADGDPGRLLERALAVVSAFSIFLAEVRRDEKHVAFPDLLADGPDASEILSRLLDLQRDEASLLTDLASLSALYLHER